MGRKKIQIKPITDEKVRKVTFNRRRNGILKKAYELSILCDTQIVVLMYDQKRMCHVYSSEDGADMHEQLMQRYIKKDFCTIDPIRNYNTSPELQLEDPSQAVWRVSREEVAVVNTYTVVPSAGTPNLPASRHLDDEDDDEADGSEQLSVKSSRTYHTKNGIAKFGADADNAKSPSHRSVSPDMQYGQISPRRSPKQFDRVMAVQQPLYQMQQGLGISGSGYTPLLRPGEHFTPILYPPQPHHNAGYMWPSPDLLPTDSFGMSILPPQVQRASLLPNSGIQYANRQLQNQMQPIYDTPLTQYAPSPMLNPPTARKSPRKEQAHFNHYVYPPQKNKSIEASRYQAQPSLSGLSESDRDSCSSPQYVYEDPSPALPPSSQTTTSPRKKPAKEPMLLNEPRIIPQPSTKSNKISSDTISCSDLSVPMDRRVTRSQSRSPQPKPRSLPKPLSPNKLQVPMHLRGPSLLDEILIDPESGAPMMESGALANWLGSTPLSGVSPGHSRETSHVRGESVSQWLNMPSISE